MSFIATREIIGVPTEAIISSIIDVPNDQGGWVYVNFLKSPYDTDLQDNRSEQYSIERLDENTWVNVVSGNAYGQDEYTYLCPTLNDSTSVNDGLANFRVIAGMDEGLFPLFRSLDDKGELEEERRLFYVALTRAEQKVYLLYATNRRRMGAETVNGLPSRFINEIPEESLDRISFSSAVTRKFVAGKKKKDGLTQMVRTVTDFDDFQVGDNVEHSIFGAGKIMALSGTGENQRVGVVFNDGTRKKLIVKFANLKKL